MNVRKRIDRRTAFEMILQLAILSCCLFRASTGQITSGPENTAALVGTEARLNCTASNVNSVILAWMMQSKTSPDQIPLYASDGTVTIDSNTYSMDINAGLGQYDLIIKSLTLNQGTRYWCQQGFAYYSYAEVVALGQLQCPTPGQAVTEGDMITGLCAVDYSSYSLLPSLKWTDASGTQLTSVSNYTSTIVESYMNFTADSSHDMMTFTCTLSIAKASLLQSSTATNIPTYTTECTTYFLVKHGVTELQFVPPTDAAGVIGSSLTPGDFINCSTNGQPQPVCTWRNVKGIGSQVTGDYLDITAEMATWSQPITYSCTATNNVNGVPYSVEKNVTFVVVEVPSGENVKTSSVEPWVIAVAVVVPLVVIVAAVIVGFCLYKRHKAKNDKGSKLSAPFITPSSTQPPGSAVPRGTGPSPYSPPNPGRSYAPIGTSSPSGYGDIGGQSLGGSVNRIYNAPAARPTVNGSVGDRSRGGSTAGSGTSTPVGRPQPSVSMLPDPRAAARAAPSPYANRDSVPLPPAPRPPSVASSAISGTSGASSATSRSGSVNLAPMTGASIAAAGGPSVAGSHGGSRPVSTTGSRIGGPVSPPPTMTYRPVDRSRSPSGTGSLQGSIV